MTLIHIDSPIEDGLSDYDKGQLDGFCGAIQLVYQHIDVLSKEAESVEACAILYRLRNRIAEDTK